MERTKIGKPSQGIVGFFGLSFSNSFCGESHRDPDEISFSLSRAPLSLCPFVANAMLSGNKKYSEERAALFVVHWSYLLALNSSGVKSLLYDSCSFRRILLPNTNRIFPTIIIGAADK